MQGAAIKRFHASGARQTEDMLCECDCLLPVSNLF
jgi:hypothetical protein